MISAITLLTSGAESSSSDTTFSTASVTPAGSYTLFGFMLGATGIADPVVSGGRATWTKIGQIASAWYTRYLYVGTGTATTEPIVVTRQGADTWNSSLWVVANVTGGLTNTPVHIQTKTATGTTIATATFDAGFTAASVALSISGTENAQGATTQSGWTQLANPTIDGEMSFQMAYRLSDAVTTAVGEYTPSGVGTAVLGVELATASSPATPYITLQFNPLP